MVGLFSRSLGPRFPPLPHNTRSTLSANQNPPKIPITIRVSPWLGNVCLWIQMMLASLTLFGKESKLCLGLFLKCLKVLVGSPENHSWQALVNSCRCTALPVIGLTYSAVIWAFLKQATLAYCWFIQCQRQRVVTTQLSEDVSLQVHLLGAQ